MWPRVLIVVITAFFLVMNVLLWQWEIAGRNDLGSPVPVRAVWEKILTAPDFSSLEILHHGRKIGDCRLVPSIGEAQRTGRVMSDEPPPEGMVRRPINYVLDLTGSVLLDPATAGQRARFSFDLKLATNYAWQEFTLRLSLRPTDWTLRSVAAEEKLRFSADEGGAHSERIFTFTELRNPDRLLRELGGPLLPATLTALGFSMPASSSVQSLSLGLKWEAHQDRLAIGNAKIRGYRLRARIFDRYQIVLFVSSIGEILRVELPDEVVLRNEALNSLYGLHD
jgi:hypothetical protein